MLARIVVAACAGLTATAIAAQAIEKPSEVSDDIILGAWSDPARCNRSNAVRYTLNEVLTSATELIGTCVAIDGYWAERALFQSEKDGNKARSNFAPRLSHRRIGIYARDGLLKIAPQRATRYTMIGTLGQCETEWPHAMMVLRYCHYTGGPILEVAEAIQLHPARGG